MGPPTKNKNGFLSWSYINIIPYFSENFLTLPGCFSGPAFLTCLVLTRYHPHYSCFLLSWDLHSQNELFLPVWLICIVPHCFNFPIYDLGDRYDALISALIEYSNSEWRNDSSFSDVSNMTLIGLTGSRKICVIKNYVILYFLYFLVFIAITNHRKHPLIKVYAGYDHRRQGRWIKNESCPCSFQT